MMYQHNPSTKIRRGNALILVVGILVLLVLVATAFITRTQSGRVTAIAQRDAAKIEDRARTISHMPADEIAIALFPRAIVATNGISDTSANTRRVPPALNTQRYGHDPSYPFNYASYEVVPRTNLPDLAPSGVYPDYPILGPDNPLGGPSFGDARWLRCTEPQRADLFDLIGQQGISDWSGFDVDGTPETFTHWRHLSNFSRSGNAWRIPFDISDIVGGGLVNDLDIPIEQWPINRPQSRAGTLILGSTGFPSMDYNADGVVDSADGVEHVRRWGNWFTIEGWAAAAFDDPREIPQNFLDLSDLNANGIPNEIGERAIDAFNPFSLRWYAELMQTDTDGDGFTDALWHLNPQSFGPDTRQIVAISVTDNSGRGNLNVATRFHRKDYYLADTALDMHGEATRGHTPADLAVVGQNNRFNGNIFPWRVGFMDNLANLPGNAQFSTPWVNYDQIGYPATGFRVNVDWNTSQWQDYGNSSFLDELGIEVNESSVNPLFIGTFNRTNDITSRYGRLWYWQLSGRDPFAATLGLRPFTLSDEIELRIAEGNNYPFVGSRLEKSLNNIVPQYNNGEVINQVLRSDYQHRHETSELRDQLDNSQLLFDNRRKLTMFSGVRNDLLPPWLRWEDRFWKRHDPLGIGLPSGHDAFDMVAYANAGLPLPIFGSAFPTKVFYEAAKAFDVGGPIGIPEVVQNWLEQSQRKVDLREYYADNATDPWWESSADGHLTLAERAPLQILLAMTNAQEQGVGSLDNTGNEAYGPLGTYMVPDPDAPWSSTIVDNPYQQTRLMAAGFASNLLSYRDEDDTWRQHSPLAFHKDGVLQRSDLPLSAMVSPPIIGRQSNDDGIEPFADAPIAGPNEPTVQLLGVEAQPFIMEVFLAHSHQALIPGSHGACCLSTGGCQDVSEETCVALLGGTYSGDGILCDGPDAIPGNADDPCPDQGACCVDTGGCIFTSRDGCLQLQGEYRGDGIACDNTTCLGACCFADGNCENLSESSCGLVGAAFAGYDSTCATTPCTLLGSCCLESGTCMDVIGSPLCIALNGTYIAGVFCASEPCLGACCIEFADCVEVAENGCIEINGSFNGVGQLCTGLSCVTAGSCCIGSESCHEVLSIDECISLGGEFMAGDRCAEDPCLGSCCLSAGACEDISVVTCINLGGEFVQGTTCAASPCRSACCFSTGGCENLLRTNCDSFGGVFVGDGIFCNAAPCLPAGACCLPDDPVDPNDGGCIEVLQAGCDLLGGTYQGNNVPCGTVPCGSDAIRGACCLETGLCQNVVSQEVCDAFGGVYQGPLVSCTELPCNPASACCLDDATCIDMLEDNCTALGGNFQIGVSCADGACVAACCLLDGSCADMLETDCITAGGAFNDERMCASSPCEAVGACCVGADVCDEVSQTSCIVTLGGVFQGAGTNCLADPCGLGTKGACCMSPLGCMVIVQSACITAGGSWSAGACDDNACNTGACCLENGDSDHCLQTLDSGACDTLGGVFHVGEDCAIDPCVGACCLWGGGCELMSRNSCDNLWDPDGDSSWGTNDPPGHFNGVGTLCGPVACVPAGSCCLPSDTCIDIMNDADFVDYCVQILGGIYRPGEYCADTLCGGACCLSTGGCENLPEATCVAINGSYMGTGVFCNTNPCGIDGACCFDSGSCMDVPEASCIVLGGTFQGTGVQCAVDTCQPYFLVTDDTDDCPQETIAVVQLANPFDREIELNNYAIEFFGQDFKLRGQNLVLPPATPENPATLILYSMPVTSTIIDPSGTKIFNDDWRDYLDITVADHPLENIGTIKTEGTVFVDVNLTGDNWSTDRTYYDDLVLDEQNSVALYKFDRSERVLIDRLDAPVSPNEFEKRIVEEMETEWNKVGIDGYIVLTDRDGNRIEALSNTSALLVQWDRATRAWGVDVPQVNGWHNDEIDAWETSPRYVFSAEDFIRSEELRDVVNAQNPTTFTDILYTSAFHWTEFVTPDDFDGLTNPSADDDLLNDNPDPWFVVDVWSPRAGTFRQGTTTQGEVIGGMRLRKPTYFDFNHKEDPAFASSTWAYMDKGWYGQSEDDDGDNTTSDSPAFADDIVVDNVINADEIDMTLAFPMQMLQKDGDFEQVGELLNCWLMGHMLEGVYDPIVPDSSLVLPVSPLDGGTAVDAGTITTFSEFMYPSTADWFAPWVATIDESTDKVVLDARVNRLRYIPRGKGGENNLPTPFMLDGRNESDPLEPTGIKTLNHPWPRLSVAARILDSFVCDGPGRPDITGDGVIDEADNFVVASDAYAHSFYNANGYTGKATPGMININTASVEVLRMLPHMYKVVHATHANDSSSLDTADRNPRSLIPEAILQWREGGNGGPNELSGTGITGGPDYGNRTATLGTDTNPMTFGAGPKHTRGFSSPAEIGLLRTTARVDDVMEPWHVSQRHQAVRDAEAWRIDYAAGEPFSDRDRTGNADWIGDEIGAPISTDVNRTDYYDYLFNVNTIAGDGVSGDAEELNLLQAGISNLISTTSDMFTVHMRIRTFKRNPITGIWDATNLDYIIDDSRYVMLVDRSNVNTPADKPRILYFEKLPN